MAKSIRINLFVVLVLPFSFLPFACKDKDGVTEPTEPPVAVWQSLGFEDKTVWRLVHAEPYLYASAGEDGLWRKNLQYANSEWQFLGLGGQISSIVWDVAVSPDNPDWLLAATTVGVFRSLDTGNSWAFARNGLEYLYDADTFYSRPVRFLQHPNYILGAGEGLFRTDNFGDSWTKISISVPGGFPYAFVMHPRFHNVMWMGGDTMIEEPFLQKSADAGVTWQTIELDSLVGLVSNVNAIACHPQDKDIVYVGYDDEIVKTTDGGQTWKKLFASGAWSLLVDPRNSDHVWSASLEIVPFETWDRGVTWLPMEGDTPLTRRVSEMTWDKIREVVYVGTVSGVFSFKQ
jgi:photosystem II stability/assembly factor-like uncharacterized protein